VEKRAARPNPPAPLTLIPIKFGIAQFNEGPEFPTREGGEIKASLLAGERFGEGFSRYREKSDFARG
jgi:hypothetical protein